MAVSHPFLAGRGRGLGMFTAEIRALLDAPRVGTLGTTNSEWTPLLTPTWQAREGEEIWLVGGPKGLKTRNIRR
ncbi:MAG: pyridoxamine 5'-phosphate oxidase family protein, partial [Thermomicrobiales bacterium]